MQKKVAKVLSIILIIHLLEVLIGAFFIGHPNFFRAYIHHGMPEDYGLSYDTIRTRVGEAWLIRHQESQKAVLLCHGRSHNRSYMLPLAGALSAHFNVAVFDFRSHGQHRFGTTSIGQRESQDVGHMLDALESEGFSDIVVYGSSMGGAAAVLELAAHPRSSVSGIVLNSVFSNLNDVLLHNFKRSLVVPSYLHSTIIKLGGAWGDFRPGDVQPYKAIREINLPVLVLQGRDDNFIPKSSGRTLSENAGGIAKLCMVAGKHDMFDNAAVQELTRAFVATLKPECGP